MWLQTLTDCNGNAQSPAAANRLISFSVFFFFLCVSFLPPCCPPQRSTPSVFPSLPPFHVLHASTFPQLEMAIENLQKSEGIATHKSSLLNSHVSQTGKKTLLKLEQILKKRLSSFCLPLCFAFHCCCEHAFFRTAPRSVYFGSP